VTKKASPPLDPGSARVLSLRKLIAQLGGARLCFGDPVRVGDREVIPVARVRTMGGGGFGSGTRADVETGGGGGGGGFVDAVPIGFIDAGPEGARFEPIPDPEAPVRMLKGGATALATLVTTVAGARALRRRTPRGALGRGPRGLLNR
jgi:uncharacterized spore protein YtfJ